MFYGWEAIHREQTELPKLFKVLLITTCILVHDHHFLYERDSILNIGQQADMERMSLQQKYAETGPSDV